MALNLTQTYTLKSNAQAALRKAIARGEAVVGEFTVATLSGGFRIVPHDTAAEAASWGKARWPAGTTPGLARLRANGHAERIRNEVLADQERASADAAASIVANSGEELAAILAANRHAAEEATSPAGWRAPEPGPSAEDEAAYRAQQADEPFVDQEPADTPADLIEEAAMRGLSPTQFTEIAERAEHDRAKIWTILQGFDRKPAAEPKPADGLSAGAAQILKALLAVAADGGWIDQKAIPHGLVGRAAPGYLAGLAKRALIEVRADKGGKFSARMTEAGVAVAQEAGR